MKKEMLILPLQFFADPDGTEEPKADESTESKAYTQAELDAETSKRVDNALKKREAAQQKAQQDAINKAIKDYAEKAKLSDEERVSAELKDLQDKLQAKEKELTTKERLTNITADLQKETLPAELAPILILQEDEDQVKAAIASVKKLITDRVNEQVKTALRQDDPRSDKAGNGTAKTGAQLIAEQRNKQNQSQGFDPWAKK